MPVTVLSPSIQYYSFGLHKNLAMYYWCSNFFLAFFLHKTSWFFLFVRVVLSPNWEDRPWSRVLMPPYLSHCFLNTPPPTYPHQPPLTRHQLCPAGQRRLWKRWGPQAYLVFDRMRSIVSIPTLSNLRTRHWLRATRIKRQGMGSYRRKGVRDGKPAHNDEKGCKVSPPGSPGH